MPVVFITDALIFVLLGLALAFAWLARSREHLRAPWRRVARSRVGMGALVVLGAYVLIGLLDSLHYRPALEPGDDPQAETVYSTEVLSLLDWWLTPLRERQEKTYSAPFATRLYAKETQELPDGRQMRAYPRLTYGGAHLQDPERERAADIAVIALGGALQAVLVWLALAAVLAWRLGRRTDARAHRAARPDREPHAATPGRWMTVRCRDGPVWAAAARRRLRPAGGHPRAPG